MRLIAFIVVAAWLSTSCHDDGPTAPSGGAPQRPSPSPSPSPSPTPSPSPSPEPPATYTYSGLVTDGQGRPVVGARVRGGPDSAYTDTTGRYEFRSQYSSVVAGNVYPPDGYEPKPWSPTESFPLKPGDNITIRRITSVTITPPATVRMVWGQTPVGAHVSFDTGQTEGPHTDPFRMTSSDATVIRPGGITGAGPYVTGLKEGTASVSARYFGVSTATFEIQVVP